MVQGGHARRAVILCIAILILANGALLLAGCALLQTPTPRPTPVVPPETSVPSPTTTPTVPAAVSTPIDPSAPVTLTLWLPAEMALGDEPPAEAVSRLNQTFMAENPQVKLDVIPKAAYGPGGLVHLLLATQPVVPARMPDIVVFDTSELHRLVDSDILIPLDELLPEAVWDDLFPFALEAVTVSENRLAVPFGANIVFLAYNSAMVEAPPRTWDEVIAARATYLFPAGQGDGSAADAFLLLYFAQGGSLEGSEPPELNTGLVANVLRKYLAAMDNGVVPGVVRTMGTLEDCWALYLAGEAGMSLAGSLQYQRDRAILKRTRYAQVPTIDGKPITLARSWAWGVVAQDPFRQEIAGRYVASAVGPKHLPAWSSASFHLPTRRSILRLAIEDREYRAFLHEQLQNARPYPNLRGYSHIQEAVLRAIQDVLDGVATPERAAITAAAMILPLR